MKLAFVHLNHYIEQGSTDFYELTQAVGRLLPGNVYVYVAQESGGKTPAAGTVILETIPVRTRSVWTLESVRFYKEVARRIATLRPDAVSVTFDRGGAIVPILVRLRLGRSSPKFIHHICSVSFARNRMRYQLSNWLTRAESSRFDAVTTLSSDIGKEIYGALFSRPIGIVPIGVNLERFKFDRWARAHVRAEMGCAETDTVFIYVGTLSALKNCDQIVCAFRQAARNSRGAHLWMVGEGPQRERLAKLVDELGLKAAVRLLGKVPYEQVPAYLSAADVGISHIIRRSRFYLQPPIKVLEYMACSLPVLATDVPGNQFYLKAACGAFTYPHEGVTGLSQALVWALSHRESLAAQRSASRRRAKSFDWKNIAASYVNWLHDNIRPQVARSMCEIPEWGF